MGHSCDRIVYETTPKLRWYPAAICLVHMIMELHFSFEKEHCPSNRGHLIRGWAQQVSRSGDPFYKSKSTAELMFRGFHLANHPIRSESRSHSSPPSSTEKKTSRKNDLSCASCHGCMNEMRNRERKIFELNYLELSSLVSAPYFR